MAKILSCKFYTSNSQDGKTLMNLNKEITQSRDFATTKLWLPNYIYVVEGLRAWCIINLKQSDYVLINPIGGKILRGFLGGNTPRRVFSKLGVPLEAYENIFGFLQDSIRSNLLLLNAPKFGITDIIDDKEHQYITSSSFSLTIELSRHCNLSCVHCYNRSSPNKKNSLELSVINKIIKTVSNLYSNLSTLTITGGEPLLYPDINAVIFNGINSGFSKLRINTNGTIFPRKRLKQLLNKYSDKIDVQITLLGATPDVHDSLAGEKGVFTQILNNIPNFVSAGVKITLAFIKTSKSNLQKKAALKIAKEFGVSITFNDFFPIGRGLDNFKELRIPTYKNKTSFPCNAHLYEGKSYGELTADKRISLLRNFPPEMPCGKNTLALSCNGDIFACIMLQGVKIGNIYEKSLVKILRSQKMKKFQKTISIDNRRICSSCELRYVCGNKCPAVSLSFEGDVSSKNPFCNYY